MKKGKIDLTSQQWNSIGEAIFLMGRQRNPSRTEVFFAPLDVAAAALAHLGVQYARHNIAIPHELNVYQQRFLAKDCIEKPGQFKCLQASIIADGLLARVFSDGKSFLVFVLDAYDAYVATECRKLRASVSPDKQIKFKTRRQFEEALKMVFSYCHHFVSYNPFGHKGREEAFRRCKAFFTDHWKSFMFSTAQHSGRAKDKFAAFKQFLQYGGVQNWYRLKLREAQQSQVTKKKGAMGGYLFHDEYYVLDLIQGYLLAHELEHFLPPDDGHSFDYLTSIQNWLHHPDTEKADVDRFDWLLGVEMSEEFYNLELEDLHHELMAKHDKEMKEKAEKAEKLKKHNDYCKAVLACFPLWTDVCILLEQRSQKEKQARDEESFQNGWGPEWNYLTTDIKAGELQWVDVDEATESVQPQAKRARWTDKWVTKVSEPPGYSTHHKKIMEAHLRPQYLFNLASTDETHLFQQQQKVWEKWWADFNDWDYKRHNNLTHSWNGKWKLDGKKFKGDQDSQIRQTLWDALSDDVPLAVDEKMISSGVKGQSFISTNIPVIFAIRRLVEYLYHYGEHGVFRAPSYNNYDLVEGNGQLSQRTVYVAIKFGFLRREWGAEYRGVMGDHDEAIWQSLREWVHAFLLRDLDILLRSFFECCVEHSPIVKRAIFDRCRGPYAWPTASPKWEDRIIWKVAKEIYGEVGETNFSTYHEAPKRMEVPVSATYASKAPKKVTKLSKAQKSWLNEAIRDKPFADHGYWEPDSKLVNGLNPKEAARSALLWRRWRTKVGLNQESDTDYSNGFESESEDEGNLIDGKWTFDDVMDCVPTEKEGKWVGVTQKRD